MEEKIIFMGTPQIAADVLKALLDAGANVTLAVCQPDRKVGRKQQVVQPAVKQLALEHGIEVFQPENIKKDFTPIVNEQADLIVTCAYGQIVPQAVLDAAKNGCVNLHGSLLPLYRGAAPIQRAIWDGRRESGMSLMKMEAGMDTGPVMDTAVMEIGSEDTSGTVFEAMGKLAGDLIVKNLKSLLEGNAQFVRQEEAKATYAPMISKAEEAIDFSREDAVILNQIRALSPAPGAYGKIKNKKLKILKARYLKQQPSGPLGQLVALDKKRLGVCLHDGILEVEQVQMEGKPVMNTADFMNGQGRSLAGGILE